MLANKHIRAGEQKYFLFHQIPVTRAWNGFHKTFSKSQKWTFFKIDFFLYSLAQGKRTSSNSQNSKEPRVSLQCVLPKTGAGLTAMTHSFLKKTTCSKKYFLSVTSGKNMGSIRAKKHPRCPLISILFLVHVFSSFFWIKNLF